jgi:hypothetical protein
VGVDIYCGRQKIAGVSWSQNKEMVKITISGAIRIIFEKGEVECNVVFVLLLATADHCNCEEECPLK